MVLKFCFKVRKFCIFIPFFLNPPLGIITLPFDVLTAVEYALDEMSLLASELHVLQFEEMFYEMFILDVTIFDPGFPL